MKRRLMVLIEPAPYIVGLLQELAAQEGDSFDVFFLCRQGTQQWDDSLEGLNAFFLPKRLPKALAALHRAIRSGRYALVHLAGWSERAILFTLIAARLHGIPALIESDTPLPEGLPLWKRAVKRALYPPLFSLPALFLPGGSRQAAYFSRYGVAGERIVVAGMTVDVEKIGRRCGELGPAGRERFRSTMGAPEGAVLFIYVGRLIECKGITLLLESFQRLCRRRTDSLLIVVGDGPLRGAVEAKVAGNPQIVFLGRLDTDGVIDALHGSDVAVVPSWKESWGLLVNEAMAAGLPVVATNAVGCVDDLVRDGATGRVVPSKDAPALAAAMEEMAREPEKRVRMGEAGRRLISGWTLEAEAATISRCWHVIAPAPEGAGT